MGVIGVAPESTIVPIKVLRDADLQGDFAWIIQGIYYAVSQDVDVINMSLGAALPTRTVTAMTRRLRGRQTRSRNWSKP